MEVQFLKGALIEVLVHSPFFQNIQPAEEGERTAGYTGIAAKSLWFWLLCLAGAALYRFLPLTMGAVPLLCAGLVITVACPFLAYWFPMTTIVTGSLYSVVQGFLLALVCREFAAEYGPLIWVAVAVTAGAFLLMLVLYGSGAVKVNHKLRAAFLTLFLLSVLGSGAVCISSFFTTALTSLFWGSGPIAIAVAVGSLLLAVINLVFEFDFTVKLVRGGARKRYEWIAAYGLFMTVVMIFLRVLELLARLTNRKED